MPKIASTAKPATSRIRTAISPGFHRRAAAGLTTRQCDHDCVTANDLRPRYRHTESLLRRWLGWSCQSICHPVSLRLAAKSGIVATLDAPIGLAFEIKRFSAVNPGAKANRDAFFSIQSLDDCRYRFLGTADCGCRADAR